MYNTFPLFLHLRWFGTRRSRLDRQNDAVKSRLLQGTIATGSNAQSSHRSLFLSLSSITPSNLPKSTEKLNSVFHSISDHEFKLNTTTAEQFLFKLTQYDYGSNLQSDLQNFSSNRIESASPFDEWEENKQINDLEGRTQTRRRHRSREFGGRYQ